MRAAEPSRLGVEIGDNDEALHRAPGLLPAAKLATLGKRRALRQEQRLVDGRRRHRAQERIQIKREAGRRLLAAAEIAPAAAELAGHLAGEEREADAGVIFEVAELAGIHREQEIGR